MSIKRIPPGYKPTIGFMESFLVYVGKNFQLTSGPMGWEMYCRLCDGVGIIGTWQNEPDGPERMRCIGRHLDDVHPGLIALKLAP